MMAVYKQLTDNTVYTKDTSKHVIDELGKVVDLVSQYRSRVEQVEKDNTAINRKLDILNKASKGHAERINKLEKLKYWI